MQLTWPDICINCGRPLRFWQKWVGMKKIEGIAGEFPLWVERSHYSCWFNKWLEHRGRHSESSTGNIRTPMTGDDAPEIDS